MSGWGEASPLPGFSRESLEEAAEQPRDLVQSVMGHGVPVAQDESIVNTVVNTVPEALEGHAYARAVVLKPTRRGGISHAALLPWRFAHGASPLGMQPVMSSAYETGVGVLALLVLAAGVGRESPAGLDTYRSLAEDVLRPRLDLAAPRVDLWAVAGTWRESITAAVPRRIT